MRKEPGVDELTTPSTAEGGGPATFHDYTI